jgi:hypothetical protein
MDDDAKNHAKLLILSHLIFVCKDNTALKRVAHSDDFDVVSSKVRAGVSRISRSSFFNDGLE